MNNTYIKPSAVIKNIFYYKKIFLLIFLFFVVIGVLVAIFSTPIYKADVLIQVEDKKSSALGGALQNVSPALDFQNSPISGQIEIFKSRSVVGRAVDSLFLTSTVTVENRFPFLVNIINKFLDKNNENLYMPPNGLEKYAFGGEDLIFETYVIPKEYDEVPLYLNVLDDKKWKLTNENNELIAEGYEGVESRTLDNRFVINFKKIIANPNAIFKIVKQNKHKFVQAVINKIDAKESGKQSGLFKAEFEDKNPNYAQRLLNAVSQSYVDSNTERKAEEAEKTLKFLEKKLPELQEKVNDAEKNLSDYRNKGLTLDVPSEVKGLLDQTINIETQRLELQMKKSEMLQRYQNNHPYIKSINSQLTQLSSEGVEVEKKIAKLPEVQRRYLTFERDAEISSRLYLNLLDTSQQLQVTKAGTVGNVNIIDKAIVPLAPYKPNKVFILSLFCFIGFFLSVVIVNIIDYYKGVLRTPDQFKKVFLCNLRAVLPISTEQSQLLNDKSVSNHVVVDVFKNSLISESLKSLKLSMDFEILKNKNSNVFLITSAIQGQGKSFLSVNLAAIYSQMGKRVLLIDADFRRSSFDKYFFKYQHKASLSKYLLFDDVRIEDIVVKNILNNLDVIFSCSPDDSKYQFDISSLYDSDKMSTLLKNVSVDYDVVIIDSAPVLPVKDAVILSRLVSKILFVVRQGSVSFSNIQASLDLFLTYDMKIESFVYNGYTPDFVSYNHYYSYYTYNSKDSFLGTTKKQKIINLFSIKLNNLFSFIKDFINR